MADVRIPGEGAGVLNFSDIPAARYREVPPPEAFAQSVACLWMTGVEGSDAVSDGRILPDGCMDLVWIRGSGVMIAGPQTTFVVRPGLRPLIAIGARFRPGILPALLRQPAAEMVNQRVSLDAVDASLARRLEAGLDAARTPAQAMRALIRGLAGRLEGMSEPDAAIAEAASLLSRPEMPVTAVASRVYVSERQLRRRFDEHVGYGPKMLQRVLRFQRLKAMLELQDADLARAGLAAGYADQPHLTRECRDLSGLTPAALAAWLR